MEVSRRHHLTIDQSNNTLGPMVAIQEWELERALVLSQLQQHRERVHYLEQKTDEDKKMYDKHRMSLLHEIKLKEVLSEKRIQDIEQRYLDQIQDLQILLDQEKQERDNEAQDIRKHYEAMLQSEQKKHERRLCGFQQRLSAKDSEYAKLQRDTIRLTQSAPTSPRTPDTPIHSDCDSVATDEQEATAVTQHYGLREADTPVRLLQEKLFKLQAHQDQMQERHQAELEKQKLAFDQERSLLQSKIQDLESLLLTKDPLQQLTQLQKEYRKGAQRVYQERLAAIERTYAEKNKQTMASYRGDLAQVKERFMHESQQTAMHHEAKMQNMISEHAHSLAELQEHHDHAMDVLLIEHQASMDELESHLERVKEDALHECERAWERKLMDAQTSMSDDAREIQNHWETRLAETSSARDAEFNRLLGELEVLKERLGREIERRQDVTQQLTKATQDVQLHKKTKAIATQECLKLQRMHRRAHTLAVTLVAAISKPHDESNDGVKATATSLGDPAKLSLPDLLQRSISEVTRLQAQNSMMEKNLESLTATSGYSSFFNLF
ncbi:hypothetical protein BDB00DRAFT_818422 [Zychaea mexicana]|uniref:uncharacterized protein n=1 Tax=Zychaea mexicana TaxID=64656 RepID=UPI0022FE73EA|nr:uncharacterized protein BDB00DRAFT_818422 [Zychaea mexicana]KAI9494534.1 hypothetical protein BDB00DRAFT_818422 [Zychaea mexicana]